MRMNLVGMGWFLLVLGWASGCGPSPGDTPPPLAPAAGAVAFGEVALGAEATRELVVANPGPGAISLDRVWVEGAGFELVTSLPVRVSARGEAVLRVRFLPRVAGAAIGHLRITGPARLHAVALSGRGLAPAPDVPPPGTGPDGERVAARCAAGCEDHDPCTVDLCDAAGECVHETAALDGVACDDGSACTGPGVCADGICLAGASVCDDGNPCTDDACGADGACVHVAAGPEGTPCDDGDPCTGDGVCAQGVCQAGAPLCDDGDPCTEDTCEAGICRSRVTDGLSCEGSGSCGAGVCVAGVCEDTPWELTAWVPLWRGADGAVLAEADFLLVQDAATLTLVDVSGPVARAVATGPLGPGETLVGARLLSDGRLVVASNRLDGGTLRLLILDGHALVPMPYTLQLPAPAASLVARGDSVFALAEGGQLFAARVGARAFVASRRIPTAYRLLVQGGDGGLLAVSGDGADGSTLTRLGGMDPLTPTPTGSASLPGCRAGPGRVAEGAGGVLVACWEEVRRLDPASLDLVTTHPIEATRVAWLDKGRFLVSSGRNLTVYDGGGEALAIQEHPAPPERVLLGRVSLVGDRLVRWEGGEPESLPAQGQGPGGRPAWLGEALWAFGPHGDRRVARSPDGALSVGPTVWRAADLLRSEGLEGGPFLDPDPRPGPGRWVDPLTGAEGRLLADGAVTASGRRAWGVRAQEAVWTGCDWAHGSEITSALIEGTDTLGPWRTDGWLPVAWLRAEGDRAVVGDLGLEVGLDGCRTPGFVKRWTRLVSWSDDGLSVLTEVVPEWTNSPIRGASMRTVRDRVAVALDMAGYDSTVKVLDLATGTAEPVATLAQPVRRLGDIVGFDGETVVLAVPPEPGSRLSAARPSLLRVVRPADPAAGLQTVALPDEVTEALVLPEGDILVTGPRGLGLVTDQCRP